MEENKQKKRRGVIPIEGLTPTQEKVMDALRDFIAARGMPPTIQELGSILGIRAPSVYEQIAAMIEKGYLRRLPRKARSLEIVEPPPGVEPSPPVLELVSVPIVGVVAAGIPIMAIENQIGEVLVESRIINGSCFALQVTGDSMIDARIGDGDLVIVRRQPVAEHGDIVVAMLGDDATVKRLYLTENTIELRPANSAYRPIQIGPDDDLRILGKVLAVRSKTSTLK